MGNAKAMTCARIMPAPGCSWIHGWPESRFYCVRDRGHDGPCQTFDGTTFTPFQPNPEALAYVAQTAVKQDLAAGRPEDPSVP